MNIANAAVVDHTGAQIVIWWVCLDPRRTQRLSGAWILDDRHDDTVRTLTADRHVLTTAAGAAALRRTGQLDWAVLQPDRMMRSVITEWHAILAAHHQANIDRKPGALLVAPRLPALPAPINVENPPKAATLPDAPRALLIARQLDAWCEVWADIEERRLSRRYLRQLFGEIMRSVPGMTESGAAA